MSASCLSFRHLFPFHSHPIHMRDKPLKERGTAVGSPQGIRMPSKYFLTLLLLLMGGLLAPIAHAQDNKKEARLRTVRGSVVDKDDNPVPSSVVYLKNDKTQAVRTYIADDAGKYRFSGLDPNVDYEIHAEHGDMVSAARNVSNFDTRKDIEVVLKLTRRKAGG